MKIIRTKDEMYSFATAQAKSGQTVGFVPTMGALHEGHLSLVKKSIEECDVSIASIFINPLQFNNREDLEKYPRTFEDDFQKLNSSGCDLVFAPTEGEIYSQEQIVKIDFGPLGSRLEGAYRPGHFDGVGVIVTKLFNLIRPTRAYFGLKDLQQYLLIRKMVEDLDMSIEVIGHPIVRESNGLAMSSRNRRLTGRGKTIASNIYKGLLLLANNFENKSLRELKEIGIEFYNQVEGLNIEYIEIIDGATLKEARSKDEDVVVCIAAFVEGIRLIDNLYLRQV